MIDLIHQAQMYYTGAPVSAAALSGGMDSNMYPGEICKCDMAKVYKYTNTLYKLRMNGAQLKRYMEWSASYYNTYHPGDLTVPFRPDIRVYNYDMFEGVLYELDIACEPGSRIRNLTWPDGSPVRDEDVFDIAVNNYRANSQLLSPGIIYEADDLPELLEIDVHREIGGIRELIRDYIVNVKGGVITPECSNNWTLVGNDWDEALHQQAVNLVKAGKLAIPVSEDGRVFNTAPITLEDLQRAQESDK